MSKGAADTMITFPGSFLNAGYHETDAIGHLFHDKDAILGTKYLETVQHDEHVLFVFVHESKEQRYGYDQFRHVVRVDLPCDAVADIVQHLDGEINPLKRTVALTDDEGNDIAFCRYTNDHVGVGTLLNGKLMVIDLDGDAIATLVHLLDAYVSAYDEYITNQVDVTKPAHVWAAIADALAAKYYPEIAALIREELYGRHPLEPVNVRLRDEHMADIVEEHASIELEATAEELVALCCTAREDRLPGAEAIITAVVWDTGVNIDRHDPYPYGVLPSTRLTANIPREHAQTVRHALDLRALDKLTVLK